MLGVFGPNGLKQRGGNPKNFLLLLLNWFQNGGTFLGGDLGLGKKRGGLKGGEENFWPGLEILFPRVICGEGGQIIFFFFTLIFFVCAFESHPPHRFFAKLICPKKREMLF